MSRNQSLARKTIPLAGIVLFLGSLSWGRVSSYYAGDPVTRPESQSAPAKQELIALIETFLKDVPSNQRSTLDRFFADDILYTRATGQVVTKNDILADTGNPTVARANATFRGEDFQIHQYGDTAIVNFRLVMQASENDKPVTRTFRNTGTFMKRNGVWQAVAWQATPIAEKK